MKYDFDKIVDRKGSYSVKWDLHPNAIPLWVADMDFKVANEIEEALVERAKHGVYGYSIIPEAYYQAEVDWWQKRFSTTIEHNWILPTIGVIPALSSSVQACTKPGDNVIVFAPVYQYFYSSVTNNHANLVIIPLLQDNGYYKIDYVALEEQAKDPKTTLLLLCNPHNPVGRVWTKPELTKLARICQRHGVVVVSDEIHRDVTYDHKTIPMQTIPEIKDQLITCTAPSKTFNIAGLKTANMIVSNPILRQQVEQALNQKEVIEPSVFGIDGLIAAYNYGEEWLDQLLEYLKQNRDYSYQYFQKELPKAVLSPLEGTYLLWIDLGAYHVGAKQMEELLLDAGVYINGGYKYKEDTTHIRINIATARSLLEKAYPIILQTVLKHQ